MKTVTSKLTGGILTLSLLLGVAAVQAAGQPSSKATFQSSELTLIPETTNTSGWVTVLDGVIKTAQNKDLFISGSLEAGIFTETIVRSRNRRRDASTASVSIQVRAMVDGEAAAPGIVTYAARTQTLAATLEGAIAGCLTIATNLDGTLSIILDEDCVEPEVIELILSTLNAASFNFVAVDVPVGVHTVSLQARITTSGSAQEGSFTATGFVGKGTMLVESVRLARR